MYVFYIQTEETRIYSAPFPSWHVAEKRAKEVAFLLGGEVKYGIEKVEKL
jgi:hypothetical protein